MNLIVDASNIIHRSFWIAQKPSADLPITDGNLQSLLFLKSLKLYVEKFKPTTIYCVWDDNLEPEVRSFRYLLHEGYKAGRDKTKRAEVYEDHNKIVKLIESLGGINVYPYRAEGDDVIACIAKKSSQKSVIVSADRDLFQLVDTHVSVYNVTNKQLITNFNFHSATGFLNVEQYIEHKIFEGDVADNIPKVLTPAKLKAYHRGDLALSVEQIAQYELNKKLMTLTGSIENQPGECDKIQEQIAMSLKKKTKSIKQFEALCSEYKLVSVINSMFSWRNVFFGQPDFGKLFAFTHPSD